MTQTSELVVELLEGLDELGNRRARDLLKELISQSCDIHMIEKEKTERKPQCSEDPEDRNGFSKRDY